MRPIRVLDIAAPLTLVCFMAAGVAVASEQSQLLYSRGLVDFHAGRHKEALALFDQAVAADPEDTSALYYRGVTRGLLGDPSGATSDFRAVLVQKPYLDVAALDLGVMLVQSGQYDEALPWLTQAQRDPELDARASLFLGIAQLRLGELTKARANFVHAGLRDPQQLGAARYYEGVVDYREGKWSAAQENFTYVATTTPDSDVGREATAFLAKIRDRLPANYEAYGAVGFQYDSNVVLAPNGGTIDLNISQQSDERMTLAAGGTYIPWYNDWLRVQMSYDFFQSFHFHLSDFNITDNGPSLQVVGKAGPFRMGMLGRYDYYFLQTDSFLQEANALPWLTFLDERGRTEVYFRYRRRDFKKKVYYVRDANNYAPGVRQFFYLDSSADHYVSVGYQFDQEDPVINASLFSPNAAEQYKYNGNQVEAGIGWTFPYAIDAAATYAYRHELYSEQSADFNPSGAIRRDNIHQIVFIVHRPLNEYLDVSVAYLGTFDDSNNVNYNYDRNIGSITLEARF